MNRKKFLSSAGKLISKQKALIAVLVMLILMLFPKTPFYTPFNIVDMLNSSSILLILAFGVTMTVISGGCDLSIGGVLVVSGIIAIRLINDLHLSIGLAIAAALLFGALVGFINGFLVVQQKTEPFIITLGMGMTLTGLAQQLTEARPVTCDNEAFTLISNGKLIPGVTNLVVIMLVMLGITHFVMRYTQFGRSLYAIGGDYEVARYSGFRVVFVKWAVVVVCGVLAALAGVLLSSKLNSGSSIYGETTALVVNCAVVVGGVSFAGGVGGIMQAALGLLVFGVLQNAMNMLNIQSFAQTLTQGIVIVVIIWLDSYSRKIKRERV